MRDVGVGDGIPQIAYFDFRETYWSYQPTNLHERSPDILTGDYVTIYFRSTAIRVHTTATIH